MGIEEFAILNWVSSVMNAAISISDVTFTLGNYLVKFDNNIFT